MLRSEAVIVIQWCAAFILLLAAAAVYFAPRWGGASVVASGVVMPESLRGGRMTMMSGPPTPDTLFLFTDFRCPYCRALAERLDAAQPLRGTIVARIFPVREPSASVQAALLASCADRVGRFRDMHDLLFSTEEHVTVDRVLESLNISDEEGFARCVEDRTTMAALQGDFDGAVRLGVSGTPTAVYRGKMYVGASTIARLVEDWEHP